MRGERTVNLMQGCSSSILASTLFLWVVRGERGTVLVGACRDLLLESPKVHFKTWCGVWYPAPANSTALNRGHNTCSLKIDLHRDYYYTCFKKATTGLHELCLRPRLHVGAVLRTSVV